MKSLKDSININEASSKLEETIMLAFAPCKTQVDYQNKIKELMSALRNMAAGKVKWGKKNASNYPEFYKHALQLSMAINSMDFDVNEILNNDKIWRE